MKKRTKMKTAIIALAVLGFTSTSVFCQDHSSTSKADKLIEQLDTNDDQMLNEEESKLNKDLFANFEKIDKDKDGFINKQEISEYLKKSKKG